MRSTNSSGIFNRIVSNQLIDLGRLALGLPSVCQGIVLFHRSPLVFSSLVILSACMASVLGSGRDVAEAACGIDVASQWHPKDDFHTLTGLHNTPEKNMQ